MKEMFQNSGSETEPSQLVSHIESASDRERIENSLQRFCQSVVEVSHKINEGNNGLILELDRDAFQELKEEFGDMADTLNESGSVVKVIKLYNDGSLGKGKLEYENQKAVYDVFEHARSEGQQDIAFVPKPLLYRDMSIDSSLREKLNAIGANVHDHAEIIVMDEIFGLDIATLLYRDLLKQEQAKDVQLQYLGNIDELSFHELHQEVSNKFFIQPNTARQGVEKKLMDEWQAAQQNAEFLVQRLGKNGYSFPEPLLAVMENSLKLLRKSGIALRDAHERNFMIGEDGKLYFIDFGETRIIERPVTDDDFEGFRLDMAVPMNLRKVNKLSAREKAKQDARPWYWNDKRAAYFFTTALSKKTAFAKNDGAAFGLAGTKQSLPEKGKVFSGKIDEFLDQWESSEQSIKEVNGFVETLLAGKIKPKKEAIPENTLKNIGSLLGGVLCKVYDRARAGRMSLASAGNLFACLQKHPLFSPVFSPVSGSLWSRNFASSEEFLEVLQDFLDQEQSAPNQ